MIYSASLRTTIAGNNPNAELIAGANLGYRLIEFGVMSNTSVPIDCALGQPSTKGVSPSSTITLLPEATDNTTAAQTILAPNWTTYPKFTSQYIFHVLLGGFQGAGAIWTPMGGFCVQKATTLCYYCMEYGSPVVDVWFVVDE